MGPISMKAPQIKFEEEIKIETPKIAGSGKSSIKTTNERDTLIIEKDGKEKTRIPLTAGWKVKSIEYLEKESKKAGVDVYSVKVSEHGFRHEEIFTIKVKNEEVVLKTGIHAVSIAFDPTIPIGVVTTIGDELSQQSSELGPETKVVMGKSGNTYLIYPLFLDMLALSSTREILATIKTPSETKTIKVPAKQKKQEKITLEQRLSESAEKITIAKPIDLTKSMDVTLPKIEPEIEIKEIDLPPELKKKPKKRIRL